MKPLLSFCLLVLLAVGSCKKEITQQDLCAGIVCLSGGHCVDGVCVCDSGYSGVQCEIYDSCFNVQCGAHSHYENGNCVCDSGWICAGCSSEAIPIDSFVGDYYMSGINQVVSVTKVNDSKLRFYGQVCRYDSYFTTNYVFTWSATPTNYGAIVFHCPFNDDSIFYYQTNGGGGGGSSSSLSGKKNH